MSRKTIGEIIHLIRTWSFSRVTDIIEIILVGSQSKLGESEITKKGSDIDIIIVIQDNANPTLLMSELADIGLQESILFHPLFMSLEEKREKINISHYKNMYESGRRIFPT